MAMHMTVVFAEALNDEEIIRCRLAAASLAKCNRIFINDDRTELLLSGEALSVDRLTEAFKEQELKTVSIRSTLNMEEDEAADDVVSSDKPNKERLRPIGR